MMPKENEEKKKKLFVDDTNKISCLQLVQDESRINTLDNIVHQWSVVKDTNKYQTSEDSY